MQNLNFLGSEAFFFLCTLLKVLRQDISSFISLILMIIDLKVVTKEFLSPVNLLKAQVFHIYKPVEVVVVGEYKHLMLRSF